MTSDAPRRVLITGCSTGFGRLAAEALAEAGCRVFASMRGPDGKNAEAAQSLREWAEARGKQVEIVALDVTDDASVHAAVERVTALAGGVDVVVNNAGVAGMGLAETYTVEQMRRLFEVNVFGVHRVCRAVLPGMRARGGGHLIFISSGLGRVVVPCLGVYGASKFALEALAETYAYELEALGIGVTVIQPGTYPTGIGANMQAWLPADAARAEGYGPAASLPESMQQGVMSVLSSDNPPDPRDVSTAILEAVMGERGATPTRVVVDKLTGQGVEAINGVAATIQGHMLDSFGLPWRGEG